MNKTVKRNVVVSAILAIMLCMSLIVGATFALFTSESKVNIAVSSGKVSVVANIDETSVETKKLYDTTYTQGASNMYEGVATFGEEGLTLEKFVPGDGIKFNIVVKNESNVTIKYRTTIACEQDNGLFSGLAVAIDGQEFNGNKCVTNWEALSVGSSDAIIPVSIELPEGAGDGYQEKSCKVTYLVEAVQGNAKTENVSDSVEINGSATEGVELKTNGDDSPIVAVSKELLNDIANATGTDSVALKHSEPKYNAAENSITFDTMEIIDAQGNEIDLEQMGNDEEITVTLPAQTKFAPGTTVRVYHDGVQITTASVNADGTITYSTTHFCEVAVSNKVLYGNAIVKSYQELTDVLSRATEDTTIVLGADITFTKQLLLNKGVEITIDLNGYDIDANISNDALIQLQNTEGNALTIKSSQDYARINVGSKALILAYADVEISNVEIIVGEIKSSSYTTIKMQKGNLTIKDNVCFNVSFLGTSLINGAQSVKIDGAELWINTFKTNAGAIISNNAATVVEIKNVVGKITLDTTYNQYFVARDADNVSIENFNASIVDKENACYEIVRIDNEYVNDKVGFKKIDVDAVYAALANGETVTINGNLTMNANASNAYGATALNIFGGTLDMNGKTFKATGANDTWDTAINITSGTIKNVKIAQGFRGIFINHNSDVVGTVYLENVIVDGSVYTISCDQGNNVHPGLEAKNCTFNGWTSFAATLGSATFTDCNFGYGAGYNFSRPYAPTEYVNCNFEAGHKIDPRAAISFENCYYDGVLITADNLSLIVSGNVDNVTIK